VKLLPKEFTKGLKDITGQFIKGVWKGMGPAPKDRRPEWQEKRRRR